MFEIFPETICRRIASTFCSIPAGVFFENLPRPTPFSCRP
jgi:hypothetical protein